MSTFTKEQLIEKLQHRISVASRFPESEKAQMDLELARIALASLEADGTLANEGTITATQFKPVADLYGLTSPTGGVTSFTFDAVEASDFIDGGWSCQEYVELGRFQEAVSGNSPVIPDGWVMVPVELTPDMRAAWDSAPYTDDDDNDMQAAYRAMIAAAPQWKVK
ncbi:hypothetical protein AACJ32_003445 [Escherichia coli]|nr:hypothetical protein [Escherichia coli]